MAEDDAGLVDPEDDAAVKGEADEDPSPGITGASSGGPTTGISVSGVGGRLPARGAPAGTAEASTEAVLPPEAGRPGPRGPHSPAADDVTLTDLDATPGVMAARERIVEQERASSRGDAGGAESGSEP